VADLVIHGWVTSYGRASWSLSCSSRDQLQAQVITRPPAWLVVLDHDQQGGRGAIQLAAIRAAPLKLIILESSPHPTIRGTRNLH